MLCRGKAFREITLADRERVVSTIQAFRANMIKSSSFHGGWGVWIHLVPLVWKTVWIHNVNSTGGHVAETSRDRRARCWFVAFVKRLVFPKWLLCFHLVLKGSLWIIKHVVCHVCQLYSDWNKSTKSPHDGVLWFRKHKRLARTLRGDES